MTWADKPQTYLGGYFWFYCDEYSERGLPPQFVWFRPPGIYVMNDERQFSTHEFRDKPGAKWYGPIQPPSPPETEHEPANQS